MENQHRKIKGYRELSQEEIDLMNEIKEKAAEVGDLISRLHRLDGTVIDGGNGDQQEAIRWRSIGRTHLQQGFMALTRSVARPDFF